MLLEKSEITQLLDQWNEGESSALEDLMPLIVQDLRQIARKHMAQESLNHTLQPTALVNEVYLRLVGRRTVSWQNRAQFFAFVAGLMRRVLVDHARGLKAAKRGNGCVKVSFDEAIRAPAQGKDPEILALDSALKELATMDERQSRIVEMRYFTGLSVQEIAEVEGVSPTTVKREWRTARMWLFSQLAS